MGTRQTRANRCQSPSRAAPYATVLLSRYVPSRTISALRHCSSFERGWPVRASSIATCTEALRGSSPEDRSPRTSRRVDGCAAIRIAVASTSPTERPNRANGSCIRPHREVRMAAMAPGSSPRAGCGAPRCRRGVPPPRTISASTALPPPQEIVPSTRKSNQPRSADTGFQGSLASVQGSVPGPGCNLTCAVC